MKAVAQRASGQYAICVLLALLGTAIHLLSAAPAGLQRFLFCGTEYVNLDDWAQANHFQLRWVTPQQELKLTVPRIAGGEGRTNTINQLTFTIDSRKNSFNGITLWLSRPIGLRNHSPCIAWKDLITTIQPLISPPKNVPGRKITTICLDPGHGGRDPGNREGKQMEKKYTLLLAKELSDLLAKSGLKVQLTHTRDTFVELPSRPEIAGRRRADLFLSLHFNSAADRSVSGSEVFCMTPAYESSTNARGEGAENGPFPANRLDQKNVLLAYELQKALVKNLGVEDRGVKRARFAVLRTAEMPAALLESGFMTHPSDAKKIYDPVWRRQLARALAEGILSYKRIVES
jgi:N-acetylmuramoyl-L-alanine amidase